MCSLGKELETMLQKQTPHAAMILDQMLIFRNIPPEKQCKYECMCTFVAFGNTTDRSLLMTCLMYAIQPEFIYSAFVKSYDSKEYETILLTKKKISISLLETFLDLFRMSTCVIPFERLMSDEMATSIHRIHCGTAPYGNFHLKSNANLRRKYYYRRHKQKQQREIQHVLEVTGWHFTADNMIRLYHELTVTRSENTNLRVRIQSFQNGVAALRL
jgi:hypothetical protein